MKNFLLAFLLALSAVFPAQSTEKIENFKEIYKQRCDFLTNEFYNDDWCNAGNSVGRTPNVVLLGDSYSNSAVGMLDEYTLIGSKSIIYEQYGRGRCPTLLGYGPDWCSAFAKMTYERIKKTPSIKTVVLASNWNDYWEGPKQFSATGRAYSREEFEKCFEATLEAYQALGKKVILMYHSPSISEPKVCVSRRLQPEKMVNQCVLNRVQAEMRESYRQFMNPVLQQLKVQSFDPYVYFCNAKECKLKDGDKIFMTTATHLSGFGGQYLARKAKPELQNILDF